MVGAEAMHDRTGESRFAISSAERLLSRIDEVTREVHRAREERAGEACVGRPACRLHRSEVAAPPIRFAPPACASPPRIA